jgi:hypothetical protein
VNIDIDDGFPVHARCITLEAGYSKEREKAHQHLEVGRIYRVRTYEVGDHYSTLTFHDLPGIWNSVFFGPATWSEYLAQDGDSDFEVVYEDEDDV